MVSATSSSTSPASTTPPGRRRGPSPLAARRARGAAVPAGALAGDWIRSHLPLLAESLPIALSALFLVLLLPHAHAGRRGAILVTVGVAAAFALAQHAAPGLLLAAVLGALLAGIGEVRCARKSS